MDEKDLLELEHRYGREVRCVVEDMLSGEGRRWRVGWDEFVANCKEEAVGVKILIAATWIAVLLIGGYVKRVSENTDEIYDSLSRLERRFHEQEERRIEAWAIKKATGGVKMDIKPCPFCGGKAELKTASYKPGESNSWIWCTECGASTTIFTRHIIQPRMKLSDEALAPVYRAWNRRVDNERTD